MAVLVYVTQLEGVTIWEHTTSVFKYRFTMRRKLLLTAVSIYWRIGVWVMPSSMMQVGGN